MTSNQILIIGSNPNLVFYAWRAQQINGVDVTLVNPTVNGSQPIRFKSSTLESSVLSAHNVQEIGQLPRDSGIKYGTVILSSSSLQDFQIVCNSIVPYLTDNAVIMVESSGYVNLEPFIQLSLPKHRKFTICSIMNESDVRQTSSNDFLHQVRNKENRIYLGTSTNSSISSNDVFKSVLKLFQKIQENSSNNISLLKSVNPKEFMTYQWKLALPRIVFNPLSVVFETAFPEELSSQILAKPLISGIINEIFKIVKKMDCKLVKGFENETNLLKNWSACYPMNSNNEDFINSPQSVYKFFKQYDLEIDLLLLQPILLADDHKIRTPYLENLYSIMCQLNKLNDKKASSIFFERRLISRSSKEYDDKLDQINFLSSSILKKQREYDSLDSSIKSKGVVKAKLDNDISNAENEVRMLRLKLEQYERDAESSRLSLQKLQIEHEQKAREMEKIRAADLPQPNVDVVQSISKGNMQNNSGEIKSKPIYRDSIQPGDNLEDLANIALYGAELNNEQPKIEHPMAQNVHPTPPTSQQATPVKSDYISSNNVDSTSKIDSNEAYYNGNIPQGVYEKDLELQGRVNKDGNAFQDHPNSSSNTNGNYNGGDSNISYNNIPNGNFNGNGSGELNGRGNYNFNQAQFFDPQSQKIPNGFNNQYYSQQQNYTQRQGYQPNNYPPNGYYPPPMEQQPPHGLPPNGLPQNGLPPNLRNNRYQNLPPNTMNQRPRLGSIPSSINSYHEGGQPQYGYPQQPYGQQYPQNFQNQHSSFQNAAPIDPSLEQRFKSNPKRHNRRSAFPQMSGNLDGLDMGGRAGMPGAQGALTAKQRGAVQPNGSHLSNRKTLSNPNLQQSQNSISPQQPQSQYLQLPSQNDSNGSSNSSSNSWNAPETPQSDSNGNINIAVPQADANSKPLGSVAVSNKQDEAKKKKKKGLFSKS